MGQENEKFKLFGDLKATFRAYVNVVGAMLGAFLGRSLDHYPRRQNKHIKTDELMREITGALGTSQLNPGDINLKLARESLDEVKELTEYQDQKSARLLTIIAFLTAAAGTIFAKIADLYPLHTILTSLHSWTRYFIIPSYAFFGLYLFCVATGALVTFHATQTRFLWPKGDEADQSEVKSYLFFQSIVRTSPAAWAQAFLMSAPPTPAAEVSDEKSVDSLSSRYYRNYIAESYLVAAKIGDKVRYLEPAQRILQLGIKLLIIWLLSLAATVALIPTAHEIEASNQSIKTSSNDDHARDCGNDKTADAKAGEAAPASYSIVGNAPTLNENSSLISKESNRGQANHPIGRRQHTLGHKHVVCGGPTATS